MVFFGGEDLSLLPLDYVHGGRRYGNMVVWGLVGVKVWGYEWGSSQRGGDLFCATMSYVYNTLLTE